MSETCDSCCMPIAELKQNAHKCAESLDVHFVAGSVKTAADMYSGIFTAIL